MQATMLALKREYKTKYKKQRERFMKGSKAPENLSEEAHQKNMEFIIPFWVMISQIQYKEYVCFIKWGEAIAKIEPGT